MSSQKPIFRRPKAAEDVEQHATYIADGSIDAALRFLERAEQTIKGVASVATAIRSLHAIPAAC